MYAVAEKGIFKMDNLNEIDSVKNTNLYKVFTYLSWTNAKSDYEGAVTELRHKQE